MANRDYTKAASLIPECFSDVALTEEESWAKGLALGCIEDTHPDAIACFIRFASVTQVCCSYCLYKDICIYIYIY